MEFKAFSKWLTVIKILAAQAVPYLTFQFLFYVPQFVQLPAGVYIYQTLFGTPTRFFFFNAMYNVFCSWVFFGFGLFPTTSPFDPTIYSPQNMAATDQLLAQGAKSSFEGETLVPNFVGATLLPPVSAGVEPLAIQEALSIQLLSKMTGHELIGVIKKLPQLPTVCDTFATTNQSGEIIGRVGVDAIKLSEFGHSQAMLHYKCAKNFSIQNFSFSSTLNVNFAFTNNPHYPLFPLIQPPADPSIGRSDLQLVYLGQYLGDRLNLEDGRCVILFFNNTYDRTPFDFNIVELKSCKTRAEWLLSTFAHRGNHPETGMPLQFYNHGYLGIIEYWPRNSYAQFNYFEIDDSFAFDFEALDQNIAKSAVEEYRKDLQDEPLAKELGVCPDFSDPTFIRSAHKNHISNALWLIVDYYNDATRHGISYSEQSSQLNLNDISAMLQRGPVSLYIPEYYHKEYPDCILPDMAPHGVHTLQQWQSQPEAPLVNFEAEQFDELESNELDYSSKKNKERIKY